MRMEVKQVTSKERLDKYDKHWKEIMDLAEKYGFIVQAYGGIATLATHKQLGVEKYKQIQEMNGMGGAE